MKIIVQGIIIDGITHSLYSPQKGTECGIKRCVKGEEIITLNNLEDITCAECKASFLRSVNILRSLSEK